MKLEVNGRIDYGQIMAIDKLLRQIAARVTTTTVAEAVDRRLGLGVGPEALLAKLHTQSFADTLHIQIDVDDPDPARAQQIAGAFGEVMQERQTAAMANEAPQERVNVTLLDRPTSARLAAPQTRSVALGGALLGFFLGFILVFLLDYVDETFRGSADIARRLSLPVVGVVPGFRGPRAPTSQRVAEGGVPTAISRPG